MIGYSVLFINDTTLKDTLWEKRVVYNTWDAALEQAISRATEEKNRYDDTYIISIVSSKSKNNCESNGNTHVFIVQRKDFGEVGKVFILPVYGE